MCFCPGRQGGLSAVLRSRRGNSAALLFKLVAAALRGTCCYPWRIRQAGLTNAYSFLFIIFLFNLYILYSLRRTCLILSVVLLSVSCFAQPAFDTAIHHAKQWLLTQEQTPADSIIRWHKTLSKTGQWADIDYAGQTSAGWTTLAHLGRVRSMAVAWSKPGNALYRHKALLKNTLLAIDHWLQKKYTNPNWWYNQIGAPQHWRDILILLTDQFSKSQQQQALQCLQQYDVKPNFTGANLAWSADLMLHDGLLTRNATKVSGAVGYIIKEIKVSTGEGIQPDYSFHQHGARLQTHHYGSAFLTDNVRLAWVLRNTPWAYPQTSLDILVNFVLEGWQWSARGSFNSPGTVDRAVSRPGFLQKAGLSNILPALIMLGGSKQAALTAMLQGQQTGLPSITGFRYFPRSDFAVYQQPAYSFFLKMISDRTLAAENINHENQQGRWLNFGDGYLIKNGTEYTDLLPVWDWKKLPGQTLFPGATTLQRQAFAGGVSNGSTGCAAMDAVASGNGKTLAAYRFWAFYNGMVICLSATTAASLPGDSMYTTLDQCRLTGPVTASNVQHIVHVADTICSGIKWLHHAGMAYIPLGNYTMQVQRKKASGSWALLSAAGSPAIIQQDVFMPAIRHNADTAIAYLLAPAATAIAAATAARDHAVHIIKNTRPLQLLRLQNNVYMAAFREAVHNFQIEENYNVSVSRPCLLLLDGSQLYASDPLQQGGLLTIGINNTSISMQLPADGTTAVFTLNK